MSRRKAAPKRPILADPLFKKKITTQFINRLMVSGKKSIAEKIFYGAMNLVANKLQGKKAGSHSIYESEETREVVLDTFKKAIDAASPTVEVRTRRVGGSNYQVPVEVRADRRLALAMRWIIENARGRGEKTMTQRLAGEILDAIEGRGGAVKKRQTVHAMAQANQAYAHYKW